MDSSLHGAEAPSAGFSSAPGRHPHAVNLQVGDHFYKRGSTTGWERRLMRESYSGYNNTSTPYSVLTVVPLLSQLCIKDPRLRGEDTTFHPERKNFLQYTGI